MGPNYGEMVFGWSPFRIISGNGPALTCSETRGPKGLKMVFFVCFRAITFIPVDLFPWNFNNDPSYKIKPGIENGGSVSTCLKTRGPIGIYVLSGI